MTIQYNANAYPSLQQYVEVMRIEEFVKHA